MSYFSFAVFRLFNVLLSSTYFVPDEIFQSVEVAYRMVFGVGYMTWEWHPSVALRSAIHPSFYAAGFWVLKETDLDYNILINWLPNIMNAFLFAASDVCYLKFLKSVFHANQKAVMPAMAFYLLNWFMLYCATRSISNNIELALTLIALKSYKPNIWNIKSSDWTSKRRKNSNESKAPSNASRSNIYGDGLRRRVKSHISDEERLLSRPSEKKINENLGDYCWTIWWAAVAVQIRPTAVIIWAPLCAAQFLESQRKISYIFIAAVPCGVAAMCFGMSVDYFYYGVMKFTLWNFVRFNVLEGGSAEFGRNVWYWYVIDGIPAVLTLSSIMLFTYTLRLWYSAVIRECDPNETVESRCSWTIPSRFFWVAVFYVVVHSFIAHKEHRFLLPILPLLIPSLVVEVERYPRIIKRYLKAIIILTNFVLAIYFGLVHQRGPNHASRIVLRDVVRHANESSIAGIEEYRILQLMPCFSMPQYVRFHNHQHFVKIGILECTPRSLLKMNTDSSQKCPSSPDGFWDDFGVNQTPFTKRMKCDCKSSGLLEDDSDCFHRDPVGWLKRDPSILRKANIIIAYRKTHSKVERLLDEAGFVTWKDIFHAHFVNSVNQDNRIVISIKKH